MIVVGTLILGASVPAPALASGAPDSSFGVAGYTTAGSATRFQSSALQSNGDLVAAGEQGVGTSANVVVARFTPLGGLDPSFGSGGLAAGPAVPTDRSTGSLARAAVIQSDGKIVVVGTATDTSGTGRNGLLIERFNANGSLDTGFGSGGVVNLMETTFGDGYSIALQPDGKILAGGTDDASGSGGTTPRVAVARLLPSGALDPTFGSGGIAVIDLGPYSYASALAVGPDGRIVLAGSQSPDLQSVNALIARLTPTGALDPAFNGTGFFAHQYARSASNSEFSALSLLPDGRILAAGAQADGNSGADAFVARFSAAGAPDTGFGSGGVASVTSSQHFAPTSQNTLPGATGVTVAKNGDVVLAGTSVNSLQTRGMFWAFTPSGALDPGFGSGGAATATPSASSSTELLGLAQDVNGNLLAVGDLVSSYGTPPTGLATRFTGPGATAPPPPPPPPKPKPSIKLTVTSVHTHIKIAATLKHGISEKLTCSLSCAYTATLSASAGTARQLKLLTSVRTCRKVHGKRRCTTRHLYRAITLGTASGKLTAGRARVITVKVAARYAKALKKARSVRLVLLTRAKNGRTTRSHSVTITLTR